MRHVLLALLIAVALLLPALTLVALYLWVPDVAADLSRAL